MPKESQRRAARRWDALHLHTISARVPVIEYVAFRTACDRAGRSMHEVVRELANRYIYDQAAKR